MKYLIACAMGALLSLSGCATYDGPRQSHVRFPDSPPPATSHAPQPQSENVRVIASNRVTHREDEAETVESSEEDTHTYPSENSNNYPGESKSNGRRQPPATYNRPRPASAAPATNRAVSGALGSLVSQAQDAYRAGNYQTAITTAERGLRIDRRAPALYLVMAQSYLALNQPAQAAQFANQGLRFSQSGTAEARALEKVRNGAAQ